MDSVFHSAQFIKPNRPFDPTYRKKNFAPMFRKTFVLEKTANAKLCVCGLGYAYYYINGKSISPDLFTSADSRYDKTLWYHVYDVSSLLQKGENTVAVICGNGWYNEDIPTVWKHSTSIYRDHPKLLLCLTVDGDSVLCTDGTWKCKPESAITFQAVRSGEHFDARLYDENWILSNYDDSAWELAIVDDTPPQGILRECPCEPIREFEVSDAQAVTRFDDGTYLFDMGKNSAGYVRVTVTGEAGRELVIRYGEFLLSNGRVRHDLPYFYPESEFQTDRLILSGKPITWSPRFAYHGFRYIEVEGLDNLDGVTVQSVFVHQAVARRTSFECSEPILNQLYDMGIRACYSNMFYKLTDCPAREKMGWTNDAHISCEQFFTNFEIERLFEKWMVDVRDVMREDGMLPGVIPTPGYGYEWGNGPLSDGILFEIPYRMYLHTGKSAMLIETLPYFERYFALLKTLEDRDGWVSSFGLGDWTTVGHSSDIPLAMTNAVLICKFYRIAALAARLADDQTLETRYSDVAEQIKCRILQAWIDLDGRCTVHQMTAVAILIAFGLFSNLEPLKQQLTELIEENDYHHHCGMLGLRYLYEALEKCGLEEFAYRIIAAKGYPSYSFWQENGATTLCEYWEMPSDKSYRSQNHHLNSDVLSWMVKRILGLYHQKFDPDQPEITVKPYFFEALTYAKGSYRTDGGEVFVSWRRQGKLIRLTVEVKGDIGVSYDGRLLPVGIHEFEVKKTV